MSVQLVAQTIQLILAPVVLITSIAIMVGGMLQMYSATNDRLRMLAQERLQLLRTADGAIARLDDKLDPFMAERLGEIDRQMPQLLRRHSLLQNAMLAEYAAILVLVISMIVIAVSAATRSSPVATEALILFLVATVTMLAGIAVFALVIRASNDAVSYEARRVLMLGKPEA